MQDAVVLPDSNAGSVEQLAHWGLMHYQNADDRVAFFYSWVTGHIRYDKDSMYVLNIGEDRDRAQRALNRRSGVCANFAALFSQLCKLSGIPAVVISGYTGTAKQPANRDGHSWSAVLLHQHWWLFDPTWDQGNVIHPQFYAIHPQEFIQTHMPFDPLWQLLDPPVSHEEYLRGVHRGALREEDSSISNRVDAFLQLDSLQQYQQVADRMRAAGITHPLQQTWYQYIRMKWSIGVERLDELNYRKAAGLLNQITDSLNQLIEYRNRQQLHAGNRSYWLRAIRHWTHQMVQVKELAGRVGSLLPNEQYNTELLLQRHVILMNKLEEQVDFLQHLR